MKKITVKNLHPGMVFSEPVYIEGNNILVPAGVEIRKKDIDRLVSWGIETVETEGEAVAVAAGQKKDKDTAGGAENTAGAPSSGAAAGKPGKAEPESPGQKESPAPQGPVKKNAPSALSLTEVQENKGAYKIYMELIERLDAVFSNIAGGVSVEVRSIDNITARLLQAVRDERDSFIGYILGGEVTGREMAKSSVNAAILSALIAIELKIPNYKIAQIITGALLHDVGMFRLPKEIIDKRGGLSGAEVQRMQAHPLYAYKIVSKTLLYPDEVGMVALQHHERWDGEGYPRRLSGEAIDLGARIVSVADAFEAMVSQKPYRNSMVGYQAMKNLLSDNSRRFDPDVLKAFIQTMGIYPIGSIILLNNGALARVIEVQGDAPLRPKIRILADEFGTVYKQDEGEIIDLLTEKSLFIAKALDPRELAKKNAK
ncbi:MAG: HD-GYP domain-containing protein [Treponema sp.]|jgi:HD-GYP domain-containing protein (c-di-GMP phosphodiesterase class II)|nr:HD-GYP domain-containing protein [Treponema sp.]